MRHPYPPSTPLIPEARQILPLRDKSAAHFGLEGLMGDERGRFLTTEYTEAVEPYLKTLKGFGV